MLEQHLQEESTGDSHPRGVIAMSERMLRHMIERQLTEFLDAWYERPGNRDREPSEQDFAAWLSEGGRQAIKGTAR